MKAKDYQILDRKDSQELAKYLSQDEQFFAAPVGIDQQFLLIGRQ